jgi:hypothetical protein
MENWLDDTDPRYIEIADHLRAVIAQMDDGFLEQMVNAEWGSNTPDYHWYVGVMQMMFCIVKNYGVDYEVFFRDWAVEPHSGFLAPEYEKRKQLGAYDKPAHK